MKAGALLFPAAVLAVGIGYTVMAFGMPRGTLNHPGPGLFPVVVGVFWLATACGCLLREIARKGTLPGSEGQAGVQRPSGKTLQLMALMAAYVPALPSLGYPVSICIFLLLAIRVFGYRRWAAALGMALALTALSYAAFVLWLKVPLPMGLLEDVLD
jgi:hypothetical protein